MSMNRLSIALDGPAGAGKSTVARLVAKGLGFNYIDTGAMYRAVTLLILRHVYDFDDEDLLTVLAENADIDLTHDPQASTRVYLNGEDVTDSIRDPEISRYVSRVAKIPGIREQMLQMQRKMGARGNVIMEGRDIGTAVLPDADFKFFLTASTEERAKRRQAELASKGHLIELEDLIKEITQRDYIDSSRETAPLKPAPDAEIIDCTDLTIEQVVEHIISRVKGRMD